MFNSAFHKSRTKDCRKFVRNTSKIAIDEHNTGIQNQIIPDRLQYDHIFKFKLGDTEWKSYCSVEAQGTWEKTWEYTLELFENNATIVFPCMGFYFHFHLPTGAFVGMLVGVSEIYHKFLRVIQFHVVHIRVGDVLGAAVGSVVGPAVGCGVIKSVAHIHIGIYIMFC